MFSFVFQIYLDILPNDDRKRVKEEHLNDLISLLNRSLNKRNLCSCLKDCDVFCDNAMVDCNLIIGSNFLQLICNKVLFKFSVNY